MLPIVYHPDYLAPLRQGHRFPMSKYGYLRDILVDRGLLPAVGGYLAPAPAGRSQLSAVHPIDYVERVLEARLTREEARRIGLPSTPRVARRAQLASAGTLLAARLALEHGIACNLAGGSHHAGPEGGAGFCVFNDVSVAARALLDEGVVRRILVVDLDVHQGDGTAETFAAEEAVFTLSLHAARNYPARKAVSDLDVALPDGMEDDAYLAALDDALARAIEAARPEIVFYNAGVDPHRADRLGRLALSDGGLRARDARVFAACRARALPVVGVLGGGYGKAPYEVSLRHALMVEEAARSADATAPAVRRSGGQSAP
ncbi:MAG: histone deacetylase [Pseudomonadota bacterium]